MLPIKPFEIAVHRHAVDDLRTRLASTRLPATGRADWAQGVPVTWLADLINDWSRFDLAGFVAECNALPQFTADVHGQMIHFVHVRGHGEPLLLTHGWPGSFCEYLRLLPLLTGDFEVVIPSLPGFAFSAPPPADGFTHDEVAHLWHALMTEGLGYRRYVAHGSDLGAGVTARLARTYPEHVRGIHLATPGLPLPAEPRTPAEEAFLREAAAWEAEEGGYSHQHATKPATLAVALNDSPAGLAAWIGEKVVAWSPTRADGTPAFDRDLLLGTLSIYWLTGTSYSSLLPYWAYRHRPLTSLADQPRGTVPTAVGIFGGERVPFPKPPRELAERYFMLTRWTEHEIGGHFPAVAEPHLLAQALREAFGADRRSASP